MTAWILDICSRKPIQVSPSPAPLLSLSLCQGITILLTTLETHFKRYDFLIFEFLRASGPCLTITLYPVSAGTVLLFKLGWMPFAESLHFNEQNSTEAAQVHCPLPLPPWWSGPYDFKRWNLVRDFVSRREVLLWHVEFTALTLFVDVFMCYEMLSQSIQEAVKYFMRCIHGWWENFKCNLGRFYLSSRRADERTHSPYWFTFTQRFIWAGKWCLIWERY